MDLASEYSQWAFLANDPEVGLILQRALADAQAGKKWSNERLTAELQKTNWWRTNPDSVRQAQALAAINPATFGQGVQQRRVAIENMAAQLGLNIPGHIAGQLAQQSVEQGWDEAQLRRALTSQGLGYFGDSPLLMDIKNLASDYGLVIGDQWASDWANKIASGAYTEDNLRATLMGLAKSLYTDADLVAALERGETVRQHFDPYAQMAAAVLELSPGSINFADPKWNRAINSWDPTLNGGQGGRRALTLGEWETVLRTEEQYGWVHTKQGRESGTQGATLLLSTFGAIG